MEDFTKILIIFGITILLWAIFYDLFTYSIAILT